MATAVGSVPEGFRAVRLRLPAAAVVVAEPSVRTGEPVVVSRAVVRSGDVVVVAGEAVVPPRREGAGPVGGCGDDAGAGPVRGCGADAGA
ncbi:MAG: hypothetical protein ACXV1K_11185, partial [Kineosporiaceae bacterium]